MALIALGVTGGIGAYKAVEVARGLQKAGHDVAAILTESARHFVGPLTFEAITHRRVVTGQFDPGANADIEHISLATDSALLLVAPATANIIGKFAGGIADDFLTSLHLATRAPLLLAPAMNTNMWNHPAVQENLRTLRARGAHVVEPGEGFLACGWSGKGRLAEPDAIVTAALAILSPAGRSLEGRAVVVTAGPTYEDIDPVRYLGNRSSGRMGYALATEAVRRGAAVTLVTGPTELAPPKGVATVRVRRAVEMHEAVMTHARSADVVIMAAAVADYAPDTAEHKLTKSDGPLTLTLHRTPDILAELGRCRAEGRLAVKVLVGFSAETRDVLGRAREKRSRKQVDLIVANDVSQAGAGFDIDTNIVTLVEAEGEQALPMQAKSSVAAAVLDRVEARLRGRAGRNG